MKFTRALEGELDGSGASARKPGQGRLGLFGLLIEGNARSLVGFS